MNENISQNNKTSWILNLFVFIGLSIFGLVLISPIFLPSIRKYMEDKYITFEYKDLLVNEQMKKWKSIIWTMCILAWILLFTAVAIEGL